MLLQFCCHMLCYFFILYLLSIFMIPKYMFAIYVLLNMITCPDYWILKKENKILEFNSKISFNTTLFNVTSILCSKDPGYIKRLGDLGTQSDTEVCSPFVAFVSFNIAFEWWLFWGKDLYLQNKLYKWKLSFHGSSFFINGIVVVSGEHKHMRLAIAIILHLL